MAVLCGLVGFIPAAAQAALVSFTSGLLDDGPTVTASGLTLTTTSVGGAVSVLTGPPYEGLWLGGLSTSGVYTLSFNAPLLSIEIEIEALSANGQIGPVETITGFVVDGNPVTIGYVDQQDTTFDGTTITATDTDGQGIISYSGPAFTTFTFSHAQGEQAGFIIERILVETAPSAIPLPAGFVLVLSGLGALALRRRAKRMA